MSVVFIVFAREEALSNDKSLDYVGCIEKFSGKQFDTNVRFREIELEEGSGYLFVLYDATHDSDRLHTIFYDAPQSIDTPEAAEYALWIQSCLTEVFSQFQVYDAKDIKFSFMTRPNSEKSCALVYDVPFEKSKFIADVATDVRKRFALVKG